MIIDCDTGMVAYSTQHRETVNPSHQSIRRRSEQMRIILLGMLHLYTCTGTTFRLWIAIMNKFSQTDVELGQFVLNLEADLVGHKCLIISKMN